MALSRQDLDSARNAAADCIRYGIEVYSMIITGRQTEDAEERRQYDKEVRRLQDEEGLARREAHFQAKKRWPRSERKAIELMRNNSQRGVQTLDVRSETDHHCPDLEPILKCWKDAIDGARIRFETWETVFTPEVNDGILLAGIPQENLTIAYQRFGLAHQAAGYCCGRWLALETDAPSISDCEGIVDGLKSRRAFISLTRSIGSHNYDADILVKHVDAEWAAAVRDLQNDTSSEADGVQGDVKDGPCHPHSWRIDGVVHNGCQAKAWRLLNYLYTAKDRTACVNDLAEPLYKDCNEIVDINNVRNLQFNGSRFLRENGIPLKVSIESGIVSLVQFDWNSAESTD